MNKTAKQRRDEQNAKRGAAGIQFWNKGASEKQMASDHAEARHDADRIRDIVAKRKNA